MAAGVAPLTALEHKACCRLVFILSAFKQVRCRKLTPKVSSDAAAAQAAALRQELLKIDAKLSFKQFVRGSGFGRNAWQASVRSATSLVEFRYSSICYILSFT